MKKLEKSNETDDDVYTIKRIAIKDFELVR
jgi:hypothetical protein